MSSKLNDDITTILDRMSANLPAGDASRESDRNAERLERRARAMASKGWESRPLKLIRSDAYDEGKASAYLSAMRASDTEDGGIVVLAGNPGSGKTAAAARWAYTRDSYAPRFLRAAEFFRWSRYDHEKRDAVLSELALVLDDAGAEYADAGGSYRVDLDELIDRFYGNRRVLVITTNIAYATPEQRDRLAAGGVKVDAGAPTFVERYGERVTDRVRECGRWVDSASVSMRRRVP